MHQAQSRDIGTDRRHVRPARIAHALSSASTQPSWSRLCRPPTSRAIPLGPGDNLHATQFRPSEASTAPPTMPPTHHEFLRAFPTVPPAHAGGGGAGAYPRLSKVCSWRLSFSLCQSLRDFAGVLDEEFRDGVERAVLQGNDTI